MGQEVQEFFGVLLTFRNKIGENDPHNYTECQMKTSEFFAANPVFSLDEAAMALAPNGGRPGTVERLKYHLRVGTLKLAARGVYAVVPPGVAADRFQPDPLLVASAVRPDGVFSHHSALELLGVAHSLWRQCTIYVKKRRRPLRVNDTTILFLEHPGALRLAASEQIGTLRVERQGRLLRASGPERTLVEGFRRPSLAGGLEELVRSASGFSTLDLDLLEKILNGYGIANLWAAVGWFLERFQQDFYVPERMLEHLAQQRPRSPHYLERDRRGGALATRWNLILPESLTSMGGPDER
jgi:predicted transcriptional regulator of viral defense system